MDVNIKIEIKNLDKILAIAKEMLTSIAVTTVGDNRASKICKNEKCDEETVNEIEEEKDVVLSKNIVQAEDVNTASTVIPTTAVIETFTQEQIAKAMVAVMDMGKMDVINSILQDLNVRSLMEIDPKEYAKIAAILKAAGGM